jgi:hypothetical protein
MSTKSREVRGHSGRQNPRRGCPPARQGGCSRGRPPRGLVNSHGRLWRPCAATDDRAMSQRPQSRRGEMRGALSPDYINAIASKLEHNTTRQAATSSRNRSDTKSSSPMVHLPLAMLRPNLLKISESALLRFGCIRTRRGEGGGSPRRPLRGLQNANEKRTAVLRPCCVD